MSSSSGEGMSGAYPLVWFWRSRLPERKGQQCRIVAKGKMNSVMVELRRCVE